MFNQLFFFFYLLAEVILQAHLFDGFKLRFQPVDVFISFHTHVFQFVNRHFGLGIKSPVLERDYERLEKDALTVWAGDHPAPTGAQVGDAHERELNRLWAEDSDAQVAALLAPDSAEALQQALMRSAKRGGCRTPG